MSREDSLLLCEYVVEVQLGLHVADPIGRTLIRGGSLSMGALLQKTGASKEELQNVITILTKHNLVSNRLDKFSNMLFYKFRHTECLLRLSMPRYLSSIVKEAKDTETILKYSILKELFLAGSLSQNEIASTIEARKKSSHLIKKIAQENDLGILVSQVCGELTQENILVGVSDEQNQSTKEIRISETQRKRDAKKTRKEQDKLDKMTRREEAAHQQEKILLKINFARFVAEERRDAVIALASKKYQCGENQDHLLEVFIALLKSESGSQHYYTQLSSLNLVNQNERLIRLQGSTASELMKLTSNLSEAKITTALKQLTQDQANIVKEAGIDKKSSQGLYGINWLSGFNSVKATLMEQIIKNTYGDHHSRVIRILRQKGMLEEKDITKICLLPAKNTNAILNRLVADGLVTTQEMILKGGSGKPLYFGAQMPNLCQKMGYNVQKATMNMMLTAGKLGKVQNLTLELNHLNF